MPPADGITVRQKSRAFFQRYRSRGEVDQNEAYVCLNLNSGLKTDVAARQRCANRRHWGADSSSPSPAIPSGEAVRSMGSGSSPRDEGSRARQNNAYLGVLAGLAIDLYKPRMLLDDDVVSN